MRPAGHHGDLALASSWDLSLDEYIHGITQEGFQQDRLSCRESIPLSLSFFLSFSPFLPPLNTLVPRPPPHTHPLTLSLFRRPPSFRFLRLLRLRLRACVFIFIFRSGEILGQVFPGKSPENQQPAPLGLSFLISEAQEEARKEMMAFDSGAEVGQ